MEGVPYWLYSTIRDDNGAYLEPCPSGDCPQRDRAVELTVKNILKNLKKAR